MTGTTSKRLFGLILFILTVMASALLPRMVAADHVGPTLFFTDSTDAPVEHVVLTALGDSVEMRVAAHNIGADNADTVQLKIVHDATIVSVTNVQCIGMYSPALASWSGAIAGVGTGAICAVQNGPLVDEGSIVEFTLTRVAPGDVTISISEVNTELDPLGTTFIEAGVKFSDLEPPVLVDTSAEVDILTVVPTPAPALTPTATTVSPPLPPPSSTGTPTPEETPAPTAPGVVLNVSAIPGNDSVTVTWDDPISDGGSPIIGFLITVSPGGLLVIAPGVENSAVIGGLEHGIEYTFQVSARTSVGLSFASVRSEPVVLLPPETPTPVPTATPTPTPTPTAIPTATPLPVDELFETRSVIDTTIDVSVVEWGEFQDSIDELFGDGAGVVGAPLEAESADGSVTIELTVKGVTTADQIIGDLVIQLGNFAFDTRDGVGTGSISLGQGLTVEGDVQLTTENDAIVVELSNNTLVYAPAPPPASVSGDLTHIDVGFIVDVSRVPDGASFTVSYASTAAELVEVAGAVFELGAIGGGAVDPETDIAFAVNVAKTGITNDDLGTNVATMTVDLVWYEARLAEGKSIVITKIGEDGLAHTVEAACELQGVAVLCVAAFEGDAGGFSLFVLMAIAEFGGSGGIDGTGEAGGTGETGTGASEAVVPTATVAAPAPAPTASGVSSTVAPADSTISNTPEGSSESSAAPVGTAISPTVNPVSAPTPTPDSLPAVDSNVLPGFGDEDKGGGISWWIGLLILIVAVSATVRIAMTIVAMKRGRATTQSA